MEELSRRRFLGAAAVLAGSGMSAALLTGCSEKDAAASTSTAKEAVTSESVSDLLAQVMDEAEITEDLTLEDGTVIPAVYLRLRNRINRIGNGVGSEVGPHSWDAVMYLWSEEDAAHECEMPMLAIFNAYDYSAVSGRTIEECTKICEDMAKRGIIYRMRRAGETFYMLLPWVNGVWEFQMNSYKTTDFLKQEMWGADFISKTHHRTKFPIFHANAISKDVVAEDKIMPYMDWEAVIKRNTMITVSPCQCRLSEVMGPRKCTDDIHPMRTCLSFGEMAEYFIENGIGEQIDQAEALGIVQNAIDHGMVPESLTNKEAEIMCCCHSDCCGMLGSIRALDGKVDAMANYSGYVLKYDKTGCIKCGKCIDRCPMKSISFGEDGYCQMDVACVRCGHCVAVCPAHARTLTANKDYPELPSNFLDSLIDLSTDRMKRGFIKDFTGTTL